MWKWNDQHVMRVGQRQNLSPDRIPTYDLPSTRWALHPLWATENSWRARPYIRFIFDTHSAYYTPTGSIIILWPRSPWVLHSSKWIKCPLGVWEVNGLNPVGDSDFYPTLVTCWSIILLHYLTSKHTNYCTHWRWLSWGFFCFFSSTTSAENNNYYI